MFTARVIRTFAVAIVSLTALAPAAHAQEEVTPRPAEVEGGKDHPRYPRFPGSVLEQFAHKEFEEYDFPHKAGDEGLATTKVTGEYWALTYDHPRKTGVAQVVNVYKNALIKAGFEIAFVSPAACAGEAALGADRKSVV